VEVQHLEHTRGRRSARMQLQRVQRHDAVQVLLVHVDVLAAVLHPLQAVALREAQGGGHARARVWRQPCPACDPLGAWNSTTRERARGSGLGRGLVPRCALHPLVILRILQRE